MERNARETPDKVAIHSLNQDKQIRHGELFQVANPMGSYFEARDIRPNERVALLSNNRSIISPLEIDNVIRQIPDVADVATVGVPDGTYGKQVVVYIHSREIAECRAGTLRWASRRFQDAARSYLPRRTPEDGAWQDGW